MGGRLTEQKPNDTDQRKIGRPDFCPAELSRLDETLN